MITNAIQNIFAIAEEVTASTDEQSHAIHGVTTIAQGLTDLSEKVNESIGKYRLLLVTEAKHLSHIRNRVKDVF